MKMVEQIKRDPSKLLKWVYNETLQNDEDTPPVKQKD